MFNCVWDIVVCLGKVVIGWLLVCVCVIGVLVGVGFLVIVLFVFIVLISFVVFSGSFGWFVLENVVVVLVLWIVFGVMYCFLLDV